MQKLTPSELTLLEQHPELTNALLALLKDTKSVKNFNILEEKAIVALQGMGNTLLTQWAQAQSEIPPISSAKHHSKKKRHSTPGSENMSLKRRCGKFGADAGETFPAKA